MVGDDDMQHQPSPRQGGAERVSEEPGDQPGPGRGPTFVVVALLALLVLAMPVAWLTGALVGFADVLGPVAYTILWAIWAIVLAVFVFVVYSMWRRAA